MLNVALPPHPGVLEPMARAVGGNRDWTLDSGLGISTRSNIKLTTLLTIDYCRLFRNPQTHWD